jgi:hypothetical protein
MLTVAPFLHYLADCCKWVKHSVWSGDKVMAARFIWFWRTQPVFVWGRIDGKEAVKRSSKKKG